MKTPTNRDLVREFEEAAQRVKDREAEEERKRGQRDETCHVCKQVIPHGEVFVPLVRNVTQRRLANPDFIGKQTVYTQAGHAPAGAICLGCIGLRNV